jgi:hypothetical protein
LSRKSSGRSTASSMPTRDRPESVQIFGKTIFNRRGKLKRETSAQSSSASSLYSAETPNDAMPAPTYVPAKEFGTKIFGRRRTLKAEAPDAAAVERKYQISGPYNFQHVTHTNKPSLPTSRPKRSLFPTALSMLSLAGRRPLGPKHRHSGCCSTHSLKSSCEYLLRDRQDRRLSPPTGPTRLYHRHASLAVSQCDMTASTH